MPFVVPPVAPSVKPQLSDTRICIVGLGYVGLTLAVALAGRRLHVHGIDIKPDWIASIAAGAAPFHEPGLEAAMQAATATGHFLPSTDIRDAATATVFVLTVGTPLGTGGHINLDYIAAAAGAVARMLKDGDLVILRSTVKIGTARSTVAPVLASSGKRFEIAVCPERTLEGRALSELAELPQVIGADSDGTRDRCVRLFRQLTPSTVPVSSLEAGELVKLVDNTYRDVTFAFANEVAHLCGHLGVSANEVIAAGKLGYARTNVARPGPVGGPCLEKDPHILAQSAKAVGAHMLVTEASRIVNERQPGDVAALIRARCHRANGLVERIAVLGLAFKGRPETDDLRGTMAKPLVEALREAFPTADIVGYDPIVAMARAEAFFSVPAAASLEDAVTGADLVVIANNHPQFKDADLGQLSRLMRAPAVIYDLWSQHAGAPEHLANGVSYVALGDERLDIATAEDLAVTAGWKQAAE